MGQTHFERPPVATFRVAVISTDTVLEVLLMNEGAKGSKCQKRFDYVVYREVGCLDCAFITSDNQIVCHNDTE